ncbi:hypothetical protein [Candidimonas nitroreducens]|uniref:VRR-NUC domain-containing protein n=1 Tax=Candidimonas nitroreducens TaxID=683354 RepID=A0A225LZK2_9BURK|nr:hypothetical protein [Candidimonas nitroreducens]OWT53383.1 hypothetical protein CEY11_24835 [Candidimonas nitroreducens]
MTPEGRVKDAVKKRLMGYGLHSVTKAADIPHDIEGFFFMPHAGPGSVWGIHDFVGCWRGVFFSIETKAPNNPEDCTEPQRAFHDSVNKSGGVSLVGVRSADAVDVLRDRVLKKVQQ